MRFHTAKWLLFLCFASCSRATLLEPAVSVSVPSASPSATPPVKTLLALPDKPKLTDLGHSLIVEFETGGKSGYDPHPEWPGGASGVTIGVGFDLGYNIKTAIASDWHELGMPVVNRLVGVAGLTGQQARQATQTVRDIYVQWAIALGVFDNVDVAKEFSGCRHEYPGFDDLRPNAQAALVSLRFNRGGSFIGPNRTEMRAIRDLVPSQNYGAIANQFRKMVRVWVGRDIYNGMKRRRLAEAKLVETP